MKKITFLLMFALSALVSTGIAGKPYDSGPPVIAQYEVDNFEFVAAPSFESTFQVFNAVEIYLFSMASDVTVQMSPVYVSEPLLPPIYDYINDDTYWRTGNYTWSNNSVFQEYYSEEFRRYEFELLE